MPSAVLYPCRLSSVPWFPVTTWQRSACFLGKRPPKDHSFYSMQQTHWLLFKSTWRLQYSLCDAADTQYLLRFYNPCHVLQPLLSPPADHNYNLRDRPHNSSFPTACHISLIVILSFECYFVTVIDCIDCIHFLSSCILSVFACLFTIIAVWQLFY